MARPLEQFAKFAAAINLRFNSCHAAQKKTSCRCLKKESFGHTAVIPSENPLVRPVVFEDGTSIALGQAFQQS